MELHRIHALQAHQSDIRRRWETLLREEPVASALADPDILTRLFSTTLGELFAALQPRPPRPEADPSAELSAAYSRIRSGCVCGRNPLLRYFLTGEQALLETQASLEAGDSTHSATAMTELHCVIRRIARREVDAFCGLCRYRASGGKPLSPPPPHHGRRGGGRRGQPSAP